jgi:putative flippase GtrA
MLIPNWMASLETITSIKNKLDVREQFRYIVSGLSAFLVDYIIFLFVFLVIGLGPVISGVLSFVCGAITGFLLQRHWTFKIRSRSMIRKQLGLYIALALFNLIFTAGALAVSKKYIPSEIAKLAIIVLIATWNYLIYRNAIFKKEDKS